MPTSRRSDNHNPTRLTTSQIETIRQTARQIFGSEVSVWLFGSRVDDSRRGGDIDLYMETPRTDTLSTSVALQNRIGRQPRPACGYCGERARKRQTDLPVGKKPRDSIVTEHLHLTQFFTEMIKTTPELLEYFQRLLNFCAKAYGIKPE
ncbi:MAG: nucleotidyltransferase domain-containing protein [Pseudomonadota bacterium]